MDLPVPEAAGDELRAAGDERRWPGVSGAFFGTDGRFRRSFFYSFVATVVLVGAVSIINAIGSTHQPTIANLIPPFIWEGSSWVTITVFFWVLWLAWRFAPPQIRPRWKLLIHAGAMPVYSLLHVGGFVALRKLAFSLMGRDYDFDGQFPYEFRKDLIAYFFFMALFALIDHLLRQQPAILPAPETFDIRDGAKLTRVLVADVIAVTSAGNYVEFHLRDDRRLLMRATLSAMEETLGPRGFLRTHRSWLVNAGQVKALRPAGSGDYVVETGSLTVPLSRRYPKALSDLRQG